MIGMALLGVFHQAIIGATNLINRKHA
jgi:hypothetical protein